MLLLLLVNLCIFTTTLVQATFVNSQYCDISPELLIFRPFITDAALDEVNKKLKFFINTQVMSSDFQQNQNRSVIIDDVNPQTNRYTTFHVDIDFMGKNFISEDLRFCQMISVKNTELFRNSPRFDNTNTSVSAASTNKKFDLDDSAWDSSQSLLTQEDSNYTAIGQTNTTIQNFFTNARGELVTCPLYYNDSIMIYYEADISAHFHRLGSYQVKFSVVSNDETPFVIGCSNSYVTPFQPDIINNIISIGVLVVMVVAAAIDIFNVTYSSYQESSNPYLFRASTICNDELLKQVDAGVPGYIMYLQYALFLGGLQLMYPGFLQPMIGQIKWCALLGFDFIKHPYYYESYRQDNVYVTLSGGGLTGLSIYGGESPLINSWPNFMVVLLVLCVILIVTRQLFIAAKLVTDKFWKKWFNRSLNKYEASFEFFSRKNLYLVVGQVCEMWFFIYGMPFLVLTSFLFLAASDVNGNHRKFASFEALENGAFSFTTCYQDLMIPQSVFTFGVSNAPPLQPIYYRKPDHVNFHDLDKRHVAPATDATDGYASMSIDTASLASGKTEYMHIPNIFIILGSLLYALWIFLPLYFIFHYLIHITKKLKVETSRNVSKLYTNLRTILFWSYLYNAYKPQRVNYVIVDIAVLFAQSMVIGLLQSHGQVQVYCLLVISITETLARFFCKPFFVKIRPWSTKFIFPIGKLLTTALCLVYISSWEISETVKTYVAYTQLATHLVVSIIFIIQMNFWLIKTVISIYRNRKVKLPNVEQISRVNTFDEFEKQFEYRPIVLCRPNPTHATLCKDDWYCASVTDVYSTGVEDEFLFRGNNTYVNDDDDHGVHSASDLDSNYSFIQQQKESNLRKLKNDYKVREADQIYEKYFTDDQIDPEVKELWESRKLANNSFNDINSDPGGGGGGGVGAINEFTMRFRNVLHRKPKETGFQVSRPKQLVVKTLAEVQQHQQQQQHHQQQEHHQQHTPNGNIVDGVEYEESNCGIIRDRSTSMSQESTVDKIITE
ncbi:uncharacterized protein LODBEIA_P56450 [Lodderomyces beijingensis]|uniref:TRP C-terminal domain-containing protein n=1 Tax=Lodderomyces beijingensis TaxID=1775926 RepID=A0ABP0ZVP4_9ASCO